MDLRKTLSPKNDVKDWTQVLIYLTNDGMCSGYVNCPHRRLLDLLNGAPPYNLEGHNQECIYIREAKIDCLNRRETAELAGISKDEILFIKPAGYNSIPLLPARYRKVRLHLPPYLIEGRIHYQWGLHWKAMLDSVFNFFPVTDVEIALQPSKIKQSARYLAVNKMHIAFMEEIDTFNDLTWHK